MCQPIAQPPLADLKNITAYGASTSATAAANTTAIQNACAAAGPPSATSGIYIPAGTFQANAMTLNCNVYGQGQSSEIYGPTDTDEMITTTADNVVFSNWQHNVASATSTGCFCNYNIHLDGISNGRMDTMMLVGGDAGGFFDDHTTNEINTNNGMFGTWRDSNYHAGENSTPSGNGVTNPIVDHTYVYNNGDDGISFVSYGTGPLLVTGALAQWNNIALSTGKIDYSRGITLLGGTNATFQHNLVQNQATNAGIYVAQESPSSYTEANVSNVLVQYNYLLNNSGPPTYNSCLLLYSAAPGQGGITDVTIEGNYIAGCNSTNGSLGTWGAGGVMSDISFVNNTVTGTNGMWNTNGSSGVTNTQCTGNTYNGVANNSGDSCGGTNPDTATGSPVSYSGCIVGTAKQYTGPITVTSGATIKAVAVFPGLTNSSVGSASYTSVPAAATPTRR
jgi:Fn3 associated